MSYIAHMNHISCFCRMGHQIGLTQRCGRIGLMGFFCLERGTSDIRVLRRGLGGVVASIWRFGRSGSLSCQERSARSRDTDAHIGRAPMRLSSLVMGDRVVCAPTVWASSHWSACLEVGGEPSPYSLGNADQPCRCMAAYPRLRVFPLAWFSVMPGLMTSRLTVC
jgi:hypothetical protein